MPPDVERRVDVVSMQPDASQTLTITIWSSLMPSTPSALEMLFLKADILSRVKSSLDAMSSFIVLCTTSPTYLTNGLRSFVLKTGYTNTLPEFPTDTLPQIWDKRFGPSAIFGVTKEWQIIAPTPPPHRAWSAAPPLSAAQHCLLKHLIRLVDGNGELERNARTIVAVTERKIQH